MRRLSKGSVKKTACTEKTNVRPVLHGHIYLYIIMMVMTGVMAAVKYRIYTTDENIKSFYGQRTEPCFDAMRDVTSSSAKRFPKSIYIIPLHRYIYISVSERITNYNSH